MKSKLSSFNFLWQKFIYKNLYNFNLEFQGQQYYMEIIKKENKKKVKLLIGKLENKMKLIRYFIQQKKFKDPYIYKLFNLFLM